MKTKRTAAQKAALEQLQYVAELIPEDRLHMNVVVDEASCGTARCLLGWGLIDPWLRNHTALGKVPLDYSFRHIPNALCNPRLHGDLVTRLDGIHDMGVLPKIFGITHREAADLFALALLLNEHEVAKADVISRIKRLRAGRKITPYKPPADSNEWQFVDHS